nr:RNA-directed DNA polymerase, eukaryota, reverse transcriptase zinc-binding domain protein [Tanacetum cinerariifolium]
QRSLERGSSWLLYVQACQEVKEAQEASKKLSGKQGNVFDNMAALKERPKSIQDDVDKNPHDASLKKEVVLVLNDFVKASKDEMKILQQKAKVKWLKEEDKNTAFFRGIIKSRSKSRVKYIKDDAGVSYEGEAVPEQFVKHFEKFLGKVEQVVSVDDSFFEAPLIAK